MSDWTSREVRAKFIALTKDYRSPDGDIVAPRCKYYRQDGSEYGFHDVPVHILVDNVRRYVSSHYYHLVRRQHVLGKIMASVPSQYKPKSPRDEPPPPGPTRNRRLHSQFQEQKSNSQLIEKLVLAAGLSPRKGLAIGGCITWWDGQGGVESCSLTGGTWKVSGGRLGRDHTLSDVPNCYVRDCLMDCINRKIEAMERKKKSIRKAAFSDLTEVEIETYCGLVAKRMEELLAAELDLVRMELSNSTSREDAAEKNPEHAAIKEQPGVKTPLPAEEHVKVGSVIYHNCDQVRAMVKRFVNEGSWKLDQFSTCAGRHHAAATDRFLGEAWASNGD
ncbi:hypothetical protein B0H63DRAFT_559224 [Podospora didyma]|uniref:DUF7726 domain-containing protein n=1 Tax=Podospora didyma TaxID=330526 RepID=A0AAE0NU42_9PEZI|nr:hypothetical protein B0H63DRAFT_559224 [Podospora didyma]